MNRFMKQFRNGLAGMFILAVILQTGCIQDEGRGGDISIISDPTGSEIWLNGEPAGETPAKFKQLAPRAYTVELRMEGYDRTYKSISLLEGQEVDLNLSLMQVAGLLLVKTDPPGSEVVINSEVMGTTPALITELPLGEYEVTIRSPGLPVQKVWVELPDRKPVQLEVRHAPRVAVNSYPPGAEILVDGELKGMAPLVLEKYSNGRTYVDGPDRSVR